MSASPGIAFDWLRRIEVVFAGLSGAGGEKTHVSTGKPDGLKISAHIVKSVQGIPGASEITLYNLSPETRSAFRRDTTKVRVSAGWENGPRAGMNQCFHGSLLSVVHHRAGSDVVTVVQALSMLDDLARSAEKLAYDAGFPVRSIVFVLASHLPGVRVDAANVVGIEAKVGDKGWAFAGTTREALNALSREYAFSWTIVDGEFQAVGDRERFGDGGVLKDPRLIDVAPILTGPLQFATGIRARCSFEAGLRPGQGVEIQSRTNPGYNGGGYRVNSVAHRLDCFAANSFTSDLTAFLPPGERSL